MLTDIAARKARGLTNLINQATLKDEEKDRAMIALLFSLKQADVGFLPF